jgi:hypothetical protein
VSEKKQGKSRHKGEFVGTYIADKEQLTKIAEVERLFDEHFGDKGRNRSRALRYIIDCFDPCVLDRFPKSQAPVGVKA